MRIVAACGRGGDAASTRATEVCRARAARTSLRSATAATIRRPDVTRRRSITARSQGLTMAISRRSSSIAAGTTRSPPCSARSRVAATGGASSKPMRGRRRCRWNSSARAHSSIHPPSHSASAAVTSSRRTVRSTASRIPGSMPPCSVRKRNSASSAVDSNMVSPGPPRELPRDDLSLLGGAGDMPGAVHGRVNPRLAGAATPCARAAAERRRKPGKRHWRGASQGNRRHASWRARRARRSSAQRALTVKPRSF